MAGKVLTGARVRLAAPGLGVVAYASGVNGSEQINWSAIDTLGVLKVMEHVAVGYTANMNFTIFREVDRSVKQTGLMPKYSDIQTSSALSMIVEDIISGKVTAKGVGVRISENRFEVTARAPVTTNLSAVVQLMLDESELSA